MGRSFTAGRSNYAGVRETRLRAGPSGLESAIQLWRTLRKPKITFKKVRKRMTFYPVFPTWGKETGDDEDESDCDDDDDDNE